ncbi:MAG: hypothetical protein LBJ67_08995 [Planctomycetaceae bacterium]|jgi:hypothetical protein|nr:hypothetical protein [Planctomycetaceae bacterium]
MLFSISDGYYRRCLRTFWFLLIFIIGINVKPFAAAQSTAFVPPTVPSTLQPPDVPIAPSLSPSGTFGTFASPVDIIYVPNGNGKLVPALIGYSLPQIDAIFQTTLNLQEPLYSIQSISADGKVVDNTANMTIQMRIRTRNEPIVRVPIGLQSGIFFISADGNLSDAVQYEGTGQCDVIANPEGKGYEILLKPKISSPVQTQQITHSITTFNTLPTRETETLKEPLPVTKPESIHDNINPPETPTPDASFKEIEQSALPESVTSPDIPLPEETPQEPENKPETESSGEPENNPLPVDTPTGMSDSEELPPTTPQQNLSSKLPASPDENTVKNEIENNIHTITLHLSFPVVQSSMKEYQLKAEFPSALTSSLQLEVPLPSATISSLQGGIFGQTTAPNEISTLFVIRSIRNDFDIHWQEEQNTGIQTSVVLQVENSNIAARLHSGGVSFDVTIPVRSIGRTFDSFRVHLPPGAVYQPASTQTLTEYQIREIKPEINSENENALLSQTIEVRLAQPTEGPVPVHFLAETPNASMQDGWLELGGFDVVGAKKQFGTLAVSVPPETRLRQHKESQGISPAYVFSPNETENIVSSFGYYEQPYLLKVQAVRQAARIYLLRPEYQVQIDRNQAILRAKYTYGIRGGKRDVEIDMNGWELMDIGPENYVNNNNISVAEDSKVTFSLPELVGKTVDIEFRAVKTIAPETTNNEIAFAFPIPEADFVEPGIAAIFPADNVKLTPFSDSGNNKIKGMSQRPRRGTPLQMETPQRLQEPLIYLIDHPEDTLFCGKLLSQKQKISVRSQSEATLYANEPVVQTLNYMVEHEPVSRLTFIVPQEIDNVQGNLRIMLDSRPLVSETVGGGMSEDFLQENHLLTNHKSANTAESSEKNEDEKITVVDSNLFNPGTKRTSSVVLKQATLPDAKIGSFQLTLSFSLPQQEKPNIPKDKTIQADIPVILPMDGKLLQESVRVRLPREIQEILARPDENEWESESPFLADVPSMTEKILSHRQPEILYHARQPISTLALGIAQDNANLLGGTTIEKSWVQVWLLPSGRVDHAVYRLTSRHDQLTIILPESVRNVKTLPVKIDGRKIDVPLENDHSLKIPLFSETIPQTIENAVFTANAISKESRTIDAFNIDSTQPRKTIFGVFETECPHTLELWYEVSAVTGTNRLMMELPKFPDEITTLLPMYCQVILSSSRHLLSCHSNWIPQYQWTFQNGYFSRTSELSQSQLEDWIGVEHSEPVTGELNSYLFRSLNPQTSCEINVADRSTLALISSGVILLIGLIFIYFSKMRYPGIVFTTVVLFASFFAYRVTMTILFLQTGALGLILVLLAMFLYRMFAVGASWEYSMVEPGTAALSGYTHPPQKAVPIAAVNPLVSNTDSDSSDQERARVVVTTKEMIPPESINNMIMPDMQNSDLGNDRTQAYQPPHEEPEMILENVSENEQEKENGK